MFLTPKNVIRLFHQSSSLLSEVHQNEIAYRLKSKDNIQSTEYPRQISQGATKTVIYCTTETSLSHSVVSNCRWLRHYLTIIAQHQKLEWLSYCSIRKTLPKFQCVQSWSYVGKDKQKFLLEVISLPNVLTCLNFVWNCRPHIVTSYI